MAGATPVGFLYTPQQLAGSLKYSSGVLLGNWREDDEIDDLRMADHIMSKETRSLTLLKKQERLAPQLVPVPLTTPPEDGIMRVGDVVLLQSLHNEGTLAVSMGQKLSAGDDLDPDEMFATFACPGIGAVSRNAIKLVGYGGEAEGTQLCYGQKVCLAFSSELGVRGYLASMRSGRSQLSTQLINKQEVFVQAIRGESPPYQCAWMVYPESVDDRVIADGSPVAAGAPFVLVHCFTNKRLASVNITLPSDFGGREYGVCCHTFVETGKVNKLMRETIGRPTSNLISRSETSENMWTVLYA